MKKAIALLLLLSTATAVEINFIEPSKTEYSFGEIPVKVEILNYTDFGNISSTTFELMRDNVILETKEAVEKDGMYVSSFSIETQGEYTLKATVKLDKDGEQSQYSNTTSFTINSSRIALSLVSPGNMTYASSPEIKVTVTASGVFVHSADVKAVIYSNGSKVTEFTVPEGRNYYRKTTSLTPGFYKLHVTASKDGQSVTDEVEFTITGEVNGTFIPGNKLLKINRISPVASKFEVGSKTDIIVQLIDVASGSKLRKPDADVEAKVITPSATRIIKLAFKDDIANPTYTTPLLLNEKGWYEIVVKANLKGYENATLYFPPIKVGKESVQLPAEMGCAQGICMKIITPKINDVLPINDTIKISVQLLQDTEEYPPISDATVTARVESENIQLEYQKNGNYYGELGPLKEGSYELTVMADWKDASISNTSVFMVSPNQLKIVPVVPTPGENVTEKGITVQVDVLDQDGDVVAGANVRAIITTPVGYVHDLRLKRNAETGHYEAKLTLTDVGTHSMKIIASEPGYVSAVKEFNFEYWEAEESLPFTQNELMLIVLIIGIVLVLLAIWKAFF